MTSFNEILTNVNTAYYRCTDISALKASLRSLDGLLNEKLLSAENRENASALKIRLELKISLLSLFESLNNQRLEGVLAKAVECGLIAQSKCYGNTVKTADRAVQLLRNCSAQLTRAEELSVRLNGALDSAVLDALSKNADALLSKVGSIKFENPFGEKVAFIDVGEKLVKVISRLKQKIDEARVQNTERECAQFVRDISVKFRTYEYFPVPEYDEGGKANAIILCTPFADEARLYAVNVDTKKPVLEAEISAFESNPESFIDEFFNYIENRGACAFIADADKLAPYKLARLLKRAMQAGKRGVKCYICDTFGDGALYGQAMDIGGREEGLSTLDISSDYLSMPPFKEVCEELQAKGIISAGDFAEVKKMPFMGFVGFNRIIRTYIAKGDKSCLKEGEKLSKANVQSAKKYLSRVRSAYQLIDSGWGDFSEFTGGEEEETHGFDYDGVREIDRENVKLIVDSNASVFSKCGMIARYCTTGGGDYTEWESLTREEMQDRVDIATKLVFRFLGVNIVPEVHILDALENSTAGGLCCDGGKRILYKADCARDWHWLVGAIVHESFHAMQAKLTSGGWSKWYYENLGITRGRVEQWKYARESAYDQNTNSNIYKVHMYECDARAFETDCDDGRNLCWGLMDFK